MNGGLSILFGDYTRARWCHYNHASKANLNRTRKIVLKEDVVSGKPTNPTSAQNSCSITSFPERKFVCWLALVALITIVASCTPSTAEPQTTPLLQQNVTQVPVNEAIPATFTLVSNEVATPTTMPIQTLTSNNTSPATEVSATTMPATEQSGDVVRPEYSELLEKVRRNGAIFVIVSLHLPVAFQPEGNLPSEQAVANQRAMIAATQDAVQQELQNYNIRVYKTYETMPVLALEVDEAALEALMVSPLIETIQEDAPTPTN